MEKIRVKGRLQRTMEAHLDHDGYKAADIEMRLKSLFSQKKPEPSQVDKCSCGQLWTNHDYSKCKLQRKKIEPLVFKPATLDECVDFVDKITIGNLCKALLCISDFRDKLNEIITHINGEGQ